jgi:hypothetical protein
MGDSLDNRLSDENPVERIFMVRRQKVNVDGVAYLYGQRFNAIRRHTIGDIDVRWQG